MLELRPICENCARALPPHSTHAMICSFECTFCKDCVNKVLENVCPNCGGGFTERPIRPKTDYNQQNYLGKYPASSKKKHRPVDRQIHQQFILNIKDIDPKLR